ncbi:MAG: 2-phospho-L-lactate transferase [Methanonatronarchaeales archaeon]|nr:2-phospho-L-lactate transferase [Methanonatronarchaeales archaeon]
MLVLSGGTGTVKLVRGLASIGADFSVAVNTADDLEVSGNLVCPDLDSVVYGLAGVLDGDLWGVRGDSFETHDRLRELGSGEYMRIGDRDRATHVLRSELMSEGHTLSEATDEVCGRLGVETDVVPMTDDEVATLVRTPSGTLHFQEFWVREGGEPEVEGVEFEGLECADPSPGLLRNLERESVVVIGPSNPVTSIGPVLGLEGVRDALSDKRVAAVSPIIGDGPVSGPAGRLLEVEGFGATSRGVEEFYGGLLNLFVTDVRDGYGDVGLDTLMRVGEDEERFASELMELLEGEGWL